MIAPDRSVHEPASLTAVLTAFRLVALLFSKLFTWVASSLAEGPGVD